MLAQLQDTESFIWYSEEFGLKYVDDGSSKRFYLKEGSLREMPLGEKQRLD